MSEAPGIPIRAVSRALSVLQAINRTPHATLTDISQQTGLPHPTVHRLLRTLMHEGMIAVEAGRKRYRPTELVRSLAVGFQDSDRLTDVARPAMVALTRETGWPVAVLVRIGHHMVIKDSTHPLTTQTFSNFYPGNTMPLFDSSAGQTYLAFCGADERKLVRARLADSDLKAGSGALLLQEKSERLAAIRADGFGTYARHMVGDHPGRTSALSVPIIARDRPLACLTIVYFAAALAMDEAIRRFAPMLQAAAAEIADQLG